MKLPGSWGMSGTTCGRYARSLPEIQCGTRGNSLSLPRSEENITRLAGWTDGSKPWMSRPTDETVGTVPLRLEPTSLPGGRRPWEIGGQRRDREVPCHRLGLPAGRAEEYPPGTRGR